MKIAIIGGGASGVTAAIYAKRTNPDAQVTIFERNDRILKKILATGNGRCNLSNANISDENYYTSSPEYVHEILTAFPKKEERQFLESLGLILCEESGRIYPYSKRANDVVDALRLELDRLGVEIKTNSKIKEIKPVKDGYSVMGKFFNKVIISAGGSAGPSFGTDGSVYRMLEEMGFKIAPVYCGLAPLKVSESTASLKGVRANCSISAYAGEKLLRTEKGELQFTDYGLSGIAIMQLSRLCKKGTKISVDLFPEMTVSELCDYLKKRAKLFEHRKLEQFFVGTLHKAICSFIISRCGLSPKSVVGTLSADDIQKLTKTMKSLTFTVISTLGWENAQATCGGAALSEFSPSTLESKKYKGIYVTGEALDSIGDCGGYNLHWAWATGAIAGKSCVL